MSIHSGSNGATNQELVLIEPNVKIVASEIRFASLSLLVRETGNGETQANVARAA